MQRIGHGRHVLIDLCGIVRGHPLIGPQHHDPVMIRDFRSIDRRQERRQLRAWFHRVQSGRNLFKIIIEHTFDNTGRQ